MESFELGAKSELFDRILRLNAAIFHEKFTNFQTQAQIVVNGVPTFVIDNAGGLRSRGVELEFNLRASNVLSLNGGVTYADSEFTDYLKGPVQLAGNPLTNAPRWSWTLAANLDQPIGDRYALTAAVNYSSRSDVFTLVADPSSEVGGYGLLGARIGFGDADGAWRIGAYARNLTDEHFSTSFLGVPGTLFARTFSNDGRRTLGAFAEMRF